VAKPVVLDIWLLPTDITHDAQYTYNSNTDIAHIHDRPARRAVLACPVHSMRVRLVITSSCAA
jgi:hypothetical protein